MNNPIGGYFSLELNSIYEKYSNAVKLNAGRYALEYILRARKYKKVYIPYYICDSVMQPINELGVSYQFYHIDSKFEIAEELNPNEDEAVLYVNYFGLKSNYASGLCYCYKNTILDYSQAFHAEPGNKHKTEGLQCDTFYSCRKFFGVADGAYLVTDCYLDETIPRDISYDRMTFLMKCKEVSPEEAYPDFLANEAAIAKAGMRRMSKLTELIMGSIDYSRKASQRMLNFQYLERHLRASNKIGWDFDCDTVPLVYPYYIENGKQLRQYLLDNQVSCNTDWPNVIEWCDNTDFEHHLVQNLVSIPIDQRYEKEDMDRIIRLVAHWTTQQQL